MDANDALQRDIRLLKYQLDDLRRAPAHVHLAKTLNETMMCLAALRREFRDVAAERGRLLAAAPAPRPPPPTGVDGA